MLHTCAKTFSSYLTVIVAGILSFPLVSPMKFATRVLRPKFGSHCKPMEHGDDKHGAICHHMFGDEINGEEFEHKSCCHLHL